VDAAVYQLAGFATTLLTSGESATDTPRGGPRPCQDRPHHPRQHLLPRLGSSFREASQGLVPYGRRHPDNRRAMPMTASVDTASAEDMRARMVAELAQRRCIRSVPVQTAMAALPKEKFLPGVALEQVYDPNEVVATKVGEDGRTISSASAPWLVARMLEFGRVRPGDTVLEIGTARGINAGYLGLITGAEGWVVSVEIDGDFIEDARAALRSVGVTNVEVHHGDGEFGAAHRAPYDVVIVTAQAADLPTAWLDQLAPTGRIVVPLRLRGLVRAFVFEPEGDHWRSTSQILCGFVSMQGAGAHPQQLVTFRPEVTLRVDGSRVDADALTALLDCEPVQVWTGMTVANNEPCLPHMDFYLATALDDYGRYHATKEAAEAGGIAWTLGIGHSATWSSDGFAVTALRRLDDETHEIGVWGHGPDGPRLAAEMAEHVRTWDASRRGGPEPVVRAYRGGTSDDKLALGRVVDRTHTRFTITF